MNAELKKHYNDALWSKIIGCTLYTNFPTLIKMQMFHFFPQVRFKAGLPYQRRFAEFEQPECTCINESLHFFLASEVEKFSKTTVDFLMDLKPVIQESLHKAIHWKTWDQLSTVQGPLSLKQLCQVNSKGSSNAGDPARIPRVIVGHDGDWLSVSPLALHHWVSDV